MSQPPQPLQQRPPAGWYVDHTGQQRWWDGMRWGPYAPHALPDARRPVQQPPMAYVPVQPNVRQSLDRAQYVRQQQGHSFMKHLLLGWLAFYIPTIYYALSPNHYFHL